jgi:hypothetical protein
VIDGIRVGATGRVEQFQQQRLCSGHLISVPALKEHSPYCTRARKIVQAATGRPGVRGFRLLPPRPRRLLVHRVCVKIVISARKAI